MKKSRIAALIAFVVLLIPLATAEEPQIGYRILSGYLEKKEAEGNSGKIVAGTILTATGGLMMAGSATTWFAGDQISQNSYGVSMDPNIKQDVSLGLGIGGVVTSAIGMGILFSKPVDYRIEYSEVFNESDAQVREALAVAALKDLSMKGKSERVTSGIINLSTPLIYIVVNSIVNLANGKNWYDNMTSGGWISVGNIAAGLGSLLGTSEEERVYEKYRAGRDALYGGQNSDTGN